MDLAHLLQPPASTSGYPDFSRLASQDTAETLGPAEKDDGLEGLLHQRSQLQGKKLEILAAELRWRLHLAAQNLHSIRQDRVAVEESLNRQTVDANYRLRDHQEKTPFYRRLFEIESEGRSQRVECWRDVANVMRDFLGTWEAHEQARARAMFLDDVGQGAAGYL